MRIQKNGMALGPSLILGLTCVGAGARALHTRMGQCVETHINKTGERLTDSKT